MRLEDIQPRCSVRGVHPDGAVTVVSVQWFGSDAVELTYKTPEGAVANELLYRHDEDRLELVAAGRPWGFDGDGAVFRLVSEAQRIRLAHLFDPVLAVHTSLVEPLPRAAEILAAKPHHWRAYFEGTRVSNMEAPPNFRPADLTPDQLREIDAYTHVENELIDEACGRVLARIAERGWADDTDVLFTTDHGELQGDFGLLFKGAYHVDALMRVPLLWRPAPSAGLPAAEVDAPVGHVDLAATFCRIAGLDAPSWLEGEVLPTSEGEANEQRRERVLTEWESEFDGDSLYLRTIHRDGFTCTVYEKSSLYEGSEGELYDTNVDPQQWQNLWDDPERQALKRELVADLYDSLPPARDPRLAVVAPV